MFKKEYFMMKIHFNFPFHWFFLWNFWIVNKDKKDILIGRFMMYNNSFVANNFYNGNRIVGEKFI